MTQNKIWSIRLWPLPHYTYRVLWKSAHNVLSNIVHRQTEKLRTKSENNTLFGGWSTDQSVAYWMLSCIIVRLYSILCCFVCVDDVDGSRMWLNSAMIPVTASLLDSSSVSMCRLWLVGSGHNWTRCRGPVVWQFLCLPWFMERMREVAWFDALSCAISQFPTYWSCGPSVRLWDRGFRSSKTLLKKV